ncbi:bromodomain adjacent to zinc finger domain protein 1A isoform X1 [Alosa sapidissima]|uniref:bromodomain adjacent to zinc finger domain protein 1A isoform X1 n=1 Tax=Alosa sapidissima TaxID=34773 RepID=UPI001C09B244|nr:bromodomain adjacent to zinc finger domain protein 1A isoform X1 [Alosa sapidissima]XP_041929379.1 bromodomain adjacent to zinc finger domain protein 1A isoform X1 [Alosa sapidissima]XP_041929380.1 bromodomain adjacent to zinc finger domain protein 1A isoform X1 [Alosa sapidissima]
MPLLHKKPFIRQKPPVDLKPEEEVFLCKVTHEIFRTYDEFFERTILCNSLVWSCAVTGKPGLTYQEALDSERRARQSLQNFPSSLVVPLLHLTALTHRTRLHEVCDDVYSYVKERFFPGEMVDMVARSGARHPCQVLEVISPHSNGALNGHTPNHVESDSIIISDSDEDTTPVSPKTPKTTPNGRKKKSSLNPSVFKYKIRLVKAENGETQLVKVAQLCRKKNVFTRDRLKLLLKQHCEPQNGVVRLKASTVAHYKLSEQNFSQIFPDEPPVFVFSPPGKSRGRRPNDASPGQVNFATESQDMMRAAEEKLRIMQQREEMAGMAQEKARMKKEREDLWEAKKKEKEDRERKREEIKKIIEEERQKRKEEKERMKIEKEKEREKLREEKKKYAERLKLWNKPREDMECEDLKELPAPVPVKTRLPAELFGDALMVLEFLQAFGELFDLKDEFPEGISLEILEEALVGCDPEGPLCELLFFFLSAIFQALAEEQEEVARDQVAEADTKDLSEALDDDADPTQSAITAVAALAAAWPQLHQGCSLKQLDLDSCTLTEILRLHILASGADCSSTNAKFRYQKQGGFASTDDPCVELRLSNPGLVKRLACTAVYDLLPGEKLKILHALCGKLLTLVSTRDFIEDSADEQRQAKQELRELKAEQHRREREEAAERVRKRKEEKLKEQELKLREKLKEEAKNGTQAAGEELDTSTESQEAQGNTEDEEEPTPNSKAKKGKGSKEKAAEVREKESLTPEELQQQQQRERELLERIQKAAACTYILPLGRDRYYRRYWLFPATGALFVEDDFFGVTEDMLLPQKPEPETQEAPKQQQQQEQEQQQQPQEEKMETDEVKTKDEEGEAKAPKEEAEAVTHRCGPPVNRPNQWAFYSSMAEVEELLEALNPRGHRENSLKEALQQEKERIAQLLDGTTGQRLNYTDKTDGKAVSTKVKSNSAPSESSAPAERHMENRLRDLLLDIEDRIYQGTLGAVKVMERSAWREALESGNYELLASEPRENGSDKSENGDVEAMELDDPHMRVSAKDRLQELKAETLSTASTSASTPQPVNNTVHYLAQALAQILQGIERKFLKAPLGDDDSKKDQKDKKKKDKKKDDDQSSEKDDGSDCGRQVKTIQERWRESLLACSSLSQVFLHLSTLERSVVWAKSLLNARCKVCRRKGDAENMLLCDGCDRGHHIHCVRPKLKAVPSEDWFCPECRPKQRSHRINSRQRSSIDSEEKVEEEEESEDEEESEEEEEEESEEEESEEEEEIAPKKNAVKLPVATKGSRSSGRSTAKQNDSVHSTPRSQQSTLKQNASAGKGAAKGSGKKATPVSNGRPPPRPGSRTSSRLSQEILTTNGPSSKTSSPAPVQTEAKKRPATEVSPKTKVVLTPSSTSSSSSRRSSGRNLGVHELSACEQLTVDLVRHEDSWPFKKLVSRTQVPDYYDIIKKPIALSIIREKVNNCEYKTASEYIEDVELMFTNCLEYNPRTTNEAKAGMRLQAFFHTELQKLGLGDRIPPPPKRPRV